MPLRHYKDNGKRSKKAPLNAVLNLTPAHLNVQEATISNDLDC